MRHLEDLGSQIPCRPLVGNSAWRDPVQNQHCERDNTGPRRCEVTPDKGVFLEGMGVSGGVSQKAEKKT